MHVEQLRIARPGVMSDPEWIALESLGENTRHFIFDDSMLVSLRERGLVEPKGTHWRVTSTGQRVLNDRRV